tara:strand:+ start:157450 stop:157932 length:483 start_codon:yes stop_codon:yes gene_type:complete
MNNRQYTIKQISYLSKEDCRFMKPCLISWLKNPKILNFFSPEMTFPFSFSTWLRHYRGFSNSKTFVILKKDWIIGHASFIIDDNKVKIFHVFIDTKYRRKRLATHLITQIQKYHEGLKTNYFYSNIISKNEPAKKLFEFLKYRGSSDTIKNNSIKYYKMK